MYFFSNFRCWIFYFGTHPYFTHVKINSLYAISLYATISRNELIA
jgi:hypothetical protein